MTQQKPDSSREQAEERLQEDALRVAKSTQSPGQTKEQTRLIAKGIEKGIALYKQQEKAKARERDKARKKALKQRTSNAGQAGQEAQMLDFELEPSPAMPALLVAGAIFSLAALMHGLRYFFGWRIVFESFEIPLSWSLAGALVTAALAFWMFRASRD